MFVYSENGKPVPDSVKIFELPEGGWCTFENGARRTVTKLTQAFDLAPSQDPSKFMVVDLIQEIRDQLNRIETKLSYSS